MSKETSYYISGTTKWKMSVPLTEEQRDDLERLIIEHDEDYIQVENPHSHYDDDGEKIYGTMFDMVERIGGENWKHLEEQEIYKVIVDGIIPITGDEWMEDK